MILNFSSLRGPATSLGQGRRPTSAPEGDAVYNPALLPERDGLLWTKGRPGPEGAVTSPKAYRRAVG